MKKNVSKVLVILIMLSLCSCAVLPSGFANDDIRTLKSWSFQYNSGTNDFSLFFGLLNGSDKYISAAVDVDIRIVNDKEEEVYSATKSVTPDDFGNYESAVSGKQYLANIRIPASEIKSGKSSNGTVYLIVYKGDSVRFDEVNCSALYCLPVSDIELKVDELPTEINVKGYDGTESIIKITDVSYTYEKEYISQLNITISGQKTYGNSSVYDIIGYKLYDNSGYLVDSGSVYLRGIGSGDKFKDDSIRIYDIVPGEIYTLQLTEHSIF